MYKSNNTNKTWTLHGVTCYQQYTPSLTLVKFYQLILHVQWCWAFGSLHTWAYSDINTSKHTFFAIFNGIRLFKIHKSQWERRVISLALFRIVDAFRTFLSDATISSRRSLKRREYYYDLYFSVPWRFTFPLVLLLLNNLKIKG